MNASAAMFVSEDNYLSALLRSRAGHIVVPSAKDPNDRERLILTMDEAYKHLRTLVAKGTISVATADEVERQLKRARVRATMQSIVREIDTFQAYSQPKESVRVDVCPGCGAHANLIFENGLWLIGSIEMALRNFWYQVQHGELNARVAAVTLNKLRTKGPRVAIRTADMPMHVQMLLQMAAQVGGGMSSMLMANDPFDDLMGDDDSMYDMFDRFMGGDGQMSFATSQGYVIGR